MYKLHLVSYIKYPTVTFASFTLPKSHAFVAVVVVDVVVVLCPYWHCHS